MTGRLAAAVGVLLGVAASAWGAGPAKDGCVVLISVDGLAGFYLDDPRAELPTIRGLAKEGARASGTVCSFPTVTWPNHTTLVTGVSPAKHGVIGNDYLDRKSGTKIPFIPDPLFDKDEIVKVPTVYDVAHKAGLVTAGVIWPASRNARTLDFTVPDMAGDEAWPKYGTPRWLAELKAAGIPVEKHGTWVKDGSGVQRDWLYTRLARHVLEHHRPNLLLVHLIELDHVQHKFGPQTPEAYWAVSHEDDRVRDIVEATRRTFGEKATIVVVSDHGFMPIEKDVRPNVVAKRLGLRGKDKEGLRVECVPQGGSCEVYLLGEGDRAGAAGRLKDELGKVEGVQAVIGPEGFAALGQPTPEQDSRAPDLWLAAKKGYTFTESEAGEEPVVARSSRAGTHGYLPDQPDLLGTLVMAGRGVRAGANVGKISNRDVAPTVARLLGVEMEGVEGKELEGALTE
jgi:predicted AlkP superfamily pyrophosphatase or phosphodiesterase